MYVADYSVLVFYHQIKPRELNFASQGTNEIQWHMQCQLRQHFLMTIEDPYRSAFQKGKVALRLSSYSAVGIGCKKDLNEALDFLLTAAALKNLSAQLICHRVFEAHARASPILQPDLLPACSVVDSDESEGRSSEVDMEDNRDWRSNDSDEEMEDSLFNPGGNEDNKSQIRPSTSETDDNMISYASDSESYRDYEYFHLSGSIHKEFKRMVSDGKLSRNDYYSWIIKTFEKGLGGVSSGAPIHVYGKEYAGIEQLPIEDICDRWTPEDILPPIGMIADDETLIERPLLHHAIVCCGLDIVEKLLKRGISPQMQDDRGNTALHIACQYGYRNLTELLVELKASASVGNNTGSVPLH